MLGVRARLGPDHPGALTLLQAFAMASGRGLDPCILGRLHDLGLLVHPLLGCFQRLSALLPRTRLMPVGTHDLFTTIGGMERPMVSHALEAVFWSRTALSVSPWPRGGLSSLLDLVGSPGHHGLALSGLDHDQGPGVLWPRRLPWPTRDLGAILSGAHLGSRKAGEASRLVVLQQTQPAQALRGEGTSH